MGWVNPLDGLGWVWVRFFIYYILLNCNSKQTQSHSSIEDGTVSLCIDMYTDDYRKQSYLDVHVSWIDRQFQKHHAALTVGKLVLSFSVKLKRHFQVSLAHKKRDQQAVS